MGFGFTGCPVFGPALHPDRTFPVPKLGLQDPFDFSSEEGPLAAQGLLRPNPHMWKSS